MFTDLSALTEPHFFYRCCIEMALKEFDSYTMQFLIFQRYFIADLVFSEKEFLSISVLSLYSF